MSSSVKIFILLNQSSAVGLRLPSNVMEANKEKIGDLVLIVTLIYRKNVNKKWGCPKIFHTFLALPIWFIIFQGVQSLF